MRRFSVRQPEMYRVIEAVTAGQLTTIDKAALCELAQTVMDLEYENLDGDLVQAGCGAGGAAIVIAHAKRRNRTLMVYDPFGGGPSTEARTRSQMAAHGADDRRSVQLVPGPYEHTLTSDTPLALVHADCGKYEPMRILLERLAPRLVSGGQLIIDDYRNKEECRRAVDEYCGRQSGFQLVRKSRLHVIRQ